MTVFNIGPMELVVILVIALIVFGPKRLPEVGRSIGRSLREFRRASDEIRGELERDPDEDEPRTDSSPSEPATSQPSPSQPAGSSSTPPPG
jgi:sec-independent protein translocase protein TatA